MQVRLRMHHRLLMTGKVVTRYLNNECGFCHLSNLCPLKPLAFSACSNSQKQEGDASLSFSRLCTRGNNFMSRTLAATESRNCVQRFVSRKAHQKESGAEVSLSRAQQPHKTARQVMLFSPWTDALLQSAGPGSSPHSRGCA